MIEGYALCNEWDYFGTFTLNPSIRNRADLDKFRADLMQLLRHLRRGPCSDAGGCGGPQQDGQESRRDVAALLVPELHRDKKGWHMHGLLRGLPRDELRPFTLSEKLPKYIRGQLRKGESIYDWPHYRERFGFVDIEPVRDRDAAARYITKYVTKGIDATAANIEVGKHLYYVTRGLRQPERMECESAPGCVPDALPTNLISGNSYPIELNGQEIGTVTWYQRP